MNRVLQPRVYPKKKLPINVLSAWYDQPEKSHIHKMQGGHLAFRWGLPDALSLGKTRESSGRLCGCVCTSCPSQGSGGSCTQAHLSLSSVLALSASPPLIGAMVRHTGFLNSSCRSTWALAFSQSSIGVHDLCERSPVSQKWLQTPQSGFLPESRLTRGLESIVRKATNVFLNKSLHIYKLYILI